jgi:hypothetical protein
LIGWAGAIAHLSGIGVKYFSIAIKNLVLSVLAGRAWERASKHVPKKKWLTLLRGHDSWFPTTTAAEIFNPRFELLIPSLTKLSVIVKTLFDEGKTDHVNVRM